MAVWALDLRVTIPLGILLAGHFGLTVYGQYLTFQSKRTLYLS